ncbi:RNA polymerase sigma factor (sigma-70 family) [Lentzea atacamensis]|uniref:RNA polymerase sigma factor (Sigma-70 family) n=1 Tax=Lentzea atacamensis TaxID=531938 RepID=A0A316HXI4_9PSEU|nr:sigma-70 family RNA polymerase sigma factor [Lentzea atacamensis]PWK84861.1 RNA polymerase sigma factor (sigma-70 family) [Lentzea atacamensis]
MGNGLSAVQDVEEYSSTSDLELLEAVRSGAGQAYGVLFERHASAARRMALQLGGTGIEADDLVAEAFAQVLAKLREGKGPTEAFRAYLLVAVRNCAYMQLRRDRSVEFVGEYRESGQTGDDLPAAAVIRDEERSTVARAFQRLPERWQVVLWHTEVEGQPAAQVAPLLGLTPNAVSALAYRARERLRQEYLAVHLPLVGDGCREVVQLLAAWVRAKAPATDRACVEAHMARCGRCRDLADELAELNGSLRAVLLPVVLGGAAAVYAKALAVPVAHAASQLTPVTATTAAKGLTGKLALAGMTMSAVIAGLVLIPPGGETNPAQPARAERAYETPVSEQPSNAPAASRSSAPPAVTRPMTAPAEQGAAASPAARPEAVPAPATTSITQPAPPALPVEHRLTASFTEPAVGLAAGGAATAARLRVGNDGTVPISSWTLVLDPPTGLFVDAVRTRDGDAILTCEPRDGAMTCRSTAELAAGSTTILELHLRAAGNARDGSLAAVVASAAMSTSAVLDVRTTPAVDPRLTLTASVVEQHGVVQVVVVRVRYDGPEPVRVRLAHTASGLDLVWMSGPGCEGLPLPLFSASCEFSLRPGQTAEVALRIVTPGSPADSRSISVVATANDLRAETTVRPR